MTTEIAESRPGEEGPVTVSVSRRVRPGREADYEAWISGVVEVARHFHGHQGVNVLRPSDKTGGRYVLIYRYDSWEHCHAWEESETRADWTAKLDELVEGEAEFKRVTGLEFWFDLPEVPAAAKPSPHKMAITLMIVVFCLVYPLQLILGPVLSPYPLWIKVALIIVIQVLLMTYVVMPRVTRIIKPWLFS
ncbi:antibiotic biosynthesis monooxygenase [Magnetospira sp. QH-2]|uniref:antibiotic biosynthesis monooxygenase n=1 Tax=Magnetospira sp. (strain QH-2) TaxID=1288970 RepID=UPI0003E80B67|nr:antibiotic biosynthesis monooxygenase [Magnetospira sp. QH-2]CCQ72617.1 conserved protein of unknown function [Magnetospira sp. QH-2]